MRPKNQFRESCPDRPRQIVPQELIEDLLGAVRGQFYGDLPPKRWFQDRNFLLRRFVLWPAAWLSKRAVTLSPERYREIVLGVLDTIKHHGSTEAVQYWPGYLAHCIQQHFACHGDEIYAEAKSLRTVLDHAVSLASNAPRLVDPIATLVQVRQALISSQKSRRRASAAAPKQLSLL